MNSLSHRILLFIVTCGYVGYLPFAPGTYASAMGCVILYLFPFPSLTTAAVFIVCFTTISIICVNILPFQGEDPHYIVVDEMAGMLITMAGHRPTILFLGAGFVFFRFFDIVKPCFIRQVERFRKGYGIMADDVLAGICGNICLCLFTYVANIFSLA